jgi:hypothetical protein
LDNPEVELASFALIDDCGSTAKIGGEPDRHDQGFWFRFQAGLMQDREV